MKKYTRAQAVELVGEESVARVESYNCDFTNRVCENGLVEFSSVTSAVDSDGDEVDLHAYYYQEQEALDAHDDMSNLDWSISHYTIG